MIGDESGGGGLVDPHAVDPPAWAAPSDDAYGHLLTDGQQVLAGQPGRDEADARDPYPQQALDGLEAETLTRYPREAATSSMRSRVSAATLGEPLRASETRLRETPAARATSLWVAA